MESEGPAPPVGSGAEPWHQKLHWLDVPERIHYKLGVTVHRCLQNKAPEYLVNCCTPVSDIPSQRHLWSGIQHHLTIPRYGYWLSTFGHRAFPVVGPTTRNLLPDSLCDPCTQQQQLQTIAKDESILSLPLMQHTQRSRDTS